MGKIIQFKPKHKQEKHNNPFKKNIILYSLILIALISLAVNIYIRKTNSINEINPMKEVEPVKEFYLA